MYQNDNEFIPSIDPEPPKEDTGTEDDEDSYDYKDFYEDEDDEWDDD